MGWQACSRNKPCNPPLGREVNKAELAGELGGDTHPAAHSLTMKPLAVAHFGLNGVAKGMAKIKQRTSPSLALIHGHNLGLELTAAIDSLRHKVGVPTHQALNVGLKPAKEILVHDAAIFNDFGHTRREFAVGKRGKAI